MIFVTLGNQNFQFKRLLDKVESLIRNGEIKEEVVAQIGHTEFQSKFIRTIDFMSKEEFDKHIGSSTFIISHAGTGSIISCLLKNKRVMVAARLKVFDEHIDNHQLEITNVFQKKNLIIALNKELSDLPLKIKNINSFNLDKFRSNNNNFNENLFHIIEKL
tara:strand:- start:238 stop:720 length:483 start_codon:yes stop_codon:yes gene_type:complete